MNKARSQLVGVVFLTYLLLTGIVLADVPVPSVPVGHPRVYLDANDVNDIKAKVLLPEFQAEWAGIKANASSEAPAAALVYLIEGNTTRGEEAIDDALSAIQSSIDARTFSSAMHWVACVYDWCYPLLTESEKTTFITEFKRIANLHQPYYPAGLSYNAVVGHNAEGWLLTAQLPAGVAIYDEDTSMYDAAAQLFFQKYVAPRDWHYPSHAYHQGDSYLSRFLHDTAATWLFRRMDAGDVFDGEQQYMPYCAIYTPRPDGRQTRRGDTYDATGTAGSKQPIFMMVGTYYQDPYLMTMTDDERFTQYFSTDILRPMQMIFREPNLPKSPISELPLTKYFDHPMGEMVARTGWEIDIDSNDAVTFMRIGGTFYSGHQSRDMGTFQIYYKGPLAVNSGIYQSTDATYPTEYGTEHWKNYYHQTISHNGLLIFDPDEDPVNDYWRSVNDGGQRVPNNGTLPDTDNVQASTYKLGEVMGWQLGPNTVTPEYSYIAGDITDAYTDKVSEVTRSMVTLNLGDANYPASMIVFDRITSADPTFKKTWLIHSIQEPTVDANTITILRDEGDYAGKLVTESILPVNPTITKIGGTGYQFWVEDSSTNYMVVPSNSSDEPAAWRVEVVPSVNEVDNVFLHVMTVMDDDESSGPVVQSIVDDNDVVAGVRLLNRAVVFGKESEFLSRLSFEVPGSGTAKILVCDLKPGTWSVSRAGENVVGITEVTNDGRCIYFEGPTGLGSEYLLNLVDADFDDDGDIDVIDLAFLVDQWLEASPQLHPQTGKTADLFSGDSVNFLDFAIFAQGWSGSASLPDPVAFYKFEGDYSNEMGGSAGTAVGNATTVYDSGRGNNVLTLDGDGDDVDFSNTSVSGIDSDITIACWMKASSLGTSSTMVAKCYAWRLLGSGTGGAARFTTAGPSNADLDGSENVADGEWHHIVGVYDGSNKYLYVDGELDNSVACTGALNTWDGYGFAAGALVKPADGLFPKFFYNGLVDDVRVYDVAMSAGQVERLYDE